MYAQPGVTAASLRKAESWAFLIDAGELHCRPLERTSSKLMSPSHGEITRLVRSRFRRYYLWKIDYGLDASRQSRINIDRTISVVVDRIGADYLAVRLFSQRVVPRAQARGAN